MMYNGCVNGKDTSISLEPEGVRYGAGFIDFADIKRLSPINHRVFIYAASGEKTEISMLGFSYDGFWEELTDLYGKRSLESLFVEEELVMLSEGEYEIGSEKGRGRIALYPDSVCILPHSDSAVRIPLCYTDILTEGYIIRLRTESGSEYTIGKMGYDTKPFAERTVRFSENTKKQRKAALSATPLTPPFTVKGLFRTKDPDKYWNAAFGRGVCAVELFTGDDAATYLYRFDEPREIFERWLAEAMESMGTHREIIFMSTDELMTKPLYRMSAARSQAVRFLRERSDGRLIHDKSHTDKLARYLGI